MLVQQMGIVGKPAQLISLASQKLYKAKAVLELLVIAEIVEPPLGVQYSHWGSVLF